MSQSEWAAANLAAVCKLSCQLPFLIDTRLSRTDEGFTISSLCRRQYYVGCDQAGFTSGTVLII
jgi:hypothetical protein